MGCGKKKPSLINIGLLAGLGAASGNLKGMPQIIGRNGGDTFTLGAYVLAF